ncbi:MAG: hypothetical protein EXS60_01225 [Candidatus Pacebacteria bacterium]|nr:hypothetical protein [Candidatus Paceibacterota bacterium]
MKPSYKVLISAAGVGQRLGYLTEFTNKALVRVGKKPAISYVIDSYPVSVPIVIVTGHFGHQVKEFVKLAYPERKNIEFVQVDTYDGKGSSLGYSMLAAKSKLQCPFVYHASDTIVVHPVPKPDRNWIGGHKGNDADATQYASWQVMDESTLTLSEKGAMDFDYLHIGLVGVRDYKQFWKVLSTLHRADPDSATLNDCRVIVDMIKEKTPFDIVHFPVWHDAGNVTSLHRAREQMPDRFHNLDKVDESIFLFDTFVIKFFANEKNVKDRVARAKFLRGLVPALEGTAGKNFYRYKFVVGSLYSRVATPPDLKRFLAWAKLNLWKKTHDVPDAEFKKTCLDFYEKKTKERVEKFLKYNTISDEAHVINGEKVPSVAEMLKMVDFNYLADTEQRRFHGDMVLENIVKTRDGYCLVDWRQNFGGLLGAGDMYYDLAKLNHNLTVNHDVVLDNGFTIKIAGSAITCDILRKDNLVRCEEVLREFVHVEGLDMRKIELLTPIIWLNMAPLHHHPFNLFLYYFGKLNLWRALQKKQ